MEKAFHRDIYKQQKIIKKGDYYQIETPDEGIPTTSKSKRQESMVVSSTNLPASEYIIKELPSFADARSQYSCQLPADYYSSRGVSDLKVELQSMLTEEGVNDEDTKEIQKLISEMEIFQNSVGELPLNELPPKKEGEKSVKDSSQSTTQIDFKAHYSTSNLESKIDKLENLNFPDLQLLEHELEIMLGEKKPLQSVSLQPLDEKSREDLNNCFNHLNGLKIVNSVSETIDRVCQNEQKHSEMKRWLEKNESITGLNADFLKELDVDQELVDRLEKSFDQNVLRVKSILKELK